ncbi:MAG TPA: hypothetical protein DCE07_03020 [Peptococcaceae bacterium]|nr:hypothetical protein [Peptococcaceae bacterium]
MKFIIFQHETSLLLLARMMIFLGRGLFFLQAPLSFLLAPTEILHGRQTPSTVLTCNALKTSKELFQDAVQWKALPRSSADRNKTRFFNSLRIK